MASAAVLVRDSVWTGPFEAAWSRSVMGVLGARLPARPLKPRPDALLALARAAYGFVAAAALAKRAIDRNAATGASNAAVLGGILSRRAPSDLDLLDALELSGAAYLADLRDPRAKALVVAWRNAFRVAAAIDFVAEAEAAAGAEFEAPDAGYMRERTRTGAFFFGAVDAYEEAERNLARDTGLGRALGACGRARCMRDAWRRSVGVASLEHRNSFLEAMERLMEENLRILYRHGRILLPPPPPPPRCGATAL